MQSDSFRKNFKVLDVFDRTITVPDSFVVRSNKIGSGNGEAKLYIANKTEVADFVSNTRASDGSLPCFLLKADLINYLNAAKSEYINSSFEFQYTPREKLLELWNQRMSFVSTLPEVIDFSVFEQDQIVGPRGYINSNDDGYQIIRDISLPLISYISIMKVSTGESVKYYFKLFVDFNAIKNIQNGPLVFKYGQKIGSPQKTSESTKNEVKKSLARDGQGKYRERLLDQCPYCPITMLNDERLLIASHIKPWAVCSDSEKIDPYNGFMLSPLYDKLFDRGFITFTDDKMMIISDWLSPANKKRLGLTEKYIQLLPMDEKRKKYLEFHREHVFQGII